MCASWFARQLGQSHSDMCVNAISQYFIGNKMCFVICVCVLIMATTSVRSPKIHSHAKWPIYCSLDWALRYGNRRITSAKPETTITTTTTTEQSFVAQLRLNRSPIRHTTPVNRSHSLALSLFLSFHLRDCECVEYVVVKKHEYTAIAIADSNELSTIACVCIGIFFLTKNRIWVRRWVICRWIVDTHSLAAFPCELCDFLIYCAVCGENERHERWCASKS